MSGSNRSGLHPFITAATITFIVIASSVIVWKLAESNTRYTQHAEYASKKYEDRAVENIVRSCTNTDIVAFSECVHKEIDSSKEHSRAEDDLAAQKGMALWAKLMAAISAGTVILTGLALYFIWRTMEFTRDTLAEAENATKAARDQAETSMKQLLATQRPKLKVRQEIVNKDEDGKWFAQVLIENNGDAVAEIIRSDFIITDDSSRPMKRPYDNGKEPPFNEFIHPHREPHVLRNGIIRHVIGKSETVEWKVVLDNKPSIEETVLLGRIVYSKPNDDFRYKLFFYRTYNIRTDRFVPIDNDPEYERED